MATSEAAADRVIDAAAFLLRHSPLIRRFIPDDIVAKAELRTPQTKKPRIVTRRKGRSASAAEDEDSVTESGTITGTPSCNIVYCEQVTLLEARCREGFSSWLPD